MQRTSRALLMPCIGLLSALGLVLGSGHGAHAGEETHAGDAPAAVPKATPARSTSSAPHSLAAWGDVPLPAAAQRGIKWLVLTQNKDGGWGQEGLIGTRGGAGASRPAPPKTRTRKPRSRRSRGTARTPPTPTRRTPATRSASDVGNTSYATLALLATGSTPARGTFQGPLKRAVAFILTHIENHTAKGAAITDRAGTQLQGKIGRYADTFLAARVLLEVDSKMPDKAGNKRVHLALRRVLAKIEANQAHDGSWNTPGSWAPIHSTAYASQALWIAQQRGHAVDAAVLHKVERFTARQIAEQARAAKLRGKPGKRRGRPKVTTPRADGSAPDIGPITVGGAGIALYSLSQGFEQLTRTAVSRKRFAAQIKRISDAVSDAKVMKGFGSMGGEEYISYANIGLAFARLGGPEAATWNKRMGVNLAKQQNRDGSWVGHHCISGRTAVTSLAVLTLVAERQLPRRAGR